MRYFTQMTREDIHKVFLEEVEKLKLRFPVAAIVEKTSYNNGIVSEYLNSKKLVSEKFFKAFCEAYNLNFEALTSDTSPKPSSPKEVILLGKHTTNRLTSEQYAESFGDWKGVPMYNNPVTASFVEAYHDESRYRPQYYLHDPRFRDCDFGAIITGDSMHSEIRHGDFIACKEVLDKSFIVFGDIYYVVATNGLETCKYINQDPKNENNLLLVPKNDSISPSPIPKDMILRLYKVRGIVRGY